MNDTDLQSALLNELAAIAPEAELGRLDPRADFRELLDLDSMDVLRFATALQQRFGVEVPESDYARISSLAGCMAYLRAHLPAPAPG